MIFPFSPSPFKFRISTFPPFYLWLLVIGLSLSFGCQKEISNKQGERPAGLYLKSILSGNGSTAKNYYYNPEGALLKIEDGFWEYFYLQDESSQTIEGYGLMDGPQDYYKLRFKNGRLAKATRVYKYYVYLPPRRSVRYKKTSEEFYYDDEGRLSYSMSGPVKASFSLDERGNITRISRRNVETNQFIEAFSFEYDSAQNPLYHFEPSTRFQLAYYTPGIYHFLYFSPNNLTAFHKVIDNGTDSVSTFFRYQYNEQDYPVSKNRIPDSGTYAAPSTAYYFYEKY